MQADLSPEDVHDLFFDDSGKPRQTPAPKPRTGPLAFAYLSPFLMLLIFTYLSSISRLYRYPTEFSAASLVPARNARTRLTMVFNRF